jgi:hypothetical protein
MPIVDSLGEKRPTFRRLPRRADSPMESGFRTKPVGVKEQYEGWLEEIQKAYGQAMLEFSRRTRRKKPQPWGFGVTTE